MKDVVLQDLPALYPGLTRAGVEQVLRTFDDPHAQAGASLASELIVIAPAIAERLMSLTGRALSAYVELLKGAAVLVLQMWTANDEPPPVSAIVAGVEALSSGT